MTDYRVSDMSTATTPTIIESFPYGRLPAAGSAGRLARVTDTTARPRLWLDDGARWSPLVDNTVNVLSFGPVSPTDPATTRATLQAALDTGANVYLPAGVYPIDSTLFFHSGQTVFGDGRAGPGSGARFTEIVVPQPKSTTPQDPPPPPVIMFQSAACPEGTRDVVIRDLNINNSNTWQPGSVGIDFTGVGYSRVERVSMRGHGTAIKGRDSALRTYVRAGSHDSWLRVTATDDLLYADGVAIAIEYRSSAGKPVVVRGTVQAVAGPDDPDYPALEVGALRSGDVSPPPTPSQLPVGAKVFHDNKNDGYYNTVVECEIANCLRGVSLTNDGDAWTVLDGNFMSNICGIYVEASDANRFRSSFVLNGVGVEFGDRSGANTVLSGSKFEGNGNLDKWTDPSVQPVVLGAVRCHKGSLRNTIESCELSDSNDYVLDETDGDNLYTGPHSTSHPTMPSGVGGGGNIVSNGDFVVESTVPGIADGWAFKGTVPTTMGFSIRSVKDHPAEVPPGTRAAQLWHMDQGVNVPFALYREIAVTPGQWYTFTARTMVDDGGDGLYTLFITTTFSSGDSRYKQLYYTGPLRSHNYYIRSLPGHDGYNAGLHRTSFEIPDGVDSIFLLVRNYLNHTNPEDPKDRSCLVEAAGGANAWFGKFHIEPGRGIATESRDCGVMSHVQTTGGPLTINDKAAITITHPFHAVAPGTGGTLKNINPPAGFSGMIVLHATGTWNATTDGTGAGKIGTPLSMTAGKTAFGWYDTGSGTWWFTPA
ncbi:hypothetical protein [Actinocrispum sp. NPDC049592]|uniref:hypothetical protein n=1 Tax=Actinocrispum sp. NPDC049592 TaxID=3154835 RepID=UPI00342DB34A